MRYLIFAGETYYADGGAHDLVASYAGTANPTIVCEHAAEIYRERKTNPNGAWCHVYDIETAKIIWTKGRSFGDYK